MHLSLIVYLKANIPKNIMYRKLYKYIDGEAKKKKKPKKQNKTHQRHRLHKCQRVCAGLETEQKSTWVRGMGLISLAEAQVSPPWVFNFQVQVEQHLSSLLTKHAQVELSLFLMVATEFRLC